MAFGGHGSSKAARADWEGRSQRAPAPSPVSEFTPTPTTLSLHPPSSGRPRRAAPRAVEVRAEPAFRHAAPAANDADFSAGELDGTVFQFRDLQLQPTPLFFAMLVCAVPLLMLGVAVGSMPSASIGALLPAITLGCLWQGIRTLQGVELRCWMPQPCFAGDTVMIDLCIDNPCRRARWDIAAMLGEAESPGGGVWVDLSPRSQHSLLLPFATTVAGRQPMPLVRLETQHPFGLVRVRASWWPRGRLLVQPRPALRGA